MTPPVKSLKQSEPQNLRFQAFDWLPTPIAVLTNDGVIVFVNAELEDVIGQSRRSLEGQSFINFFTDSKPLKHALAGAKANEFAALRYDSELLRIKQEDSLPVHVIVAQSDLPGEIIIELLPIQQQTRQDREERLFDQAQANKELIRNLAHEIKNPLTPIQLSAERLERKLGGKLEEAEQSVLSKSVKTIVDQVSAMKRLSFATRIFCTFMNCMWRATIGTTAAMVSLG